MWSPLCACSYSFQIAYANILGGGLYPICRFLCHNLCDQFNRSISCFIHLLFGGRRRDQMYICILFGFYLSFTYTESDVFLWLLSLKSWYFVTYFSLTCWPLKVINTKLKILVAHNFKSIWNINLTFVTQTNHKVFSSLRGCLYRFDIYKGQKGQQNTLST